MYTRIMKISGSLEIPCHVLVPFRFVLFVIFAKARDMTIDVTLWFVSAPSCISLGLASLPFIRTLSFPCFCLILFLVYLTILTLHSARVVFVKISLQGIPTPSNSDHHVFSHDLHRQKETKQSLLVTCHVTQHGVLLEFVWCRLLAYLTFLYDHM